MGQPVQLIAPDGTATAEDRYRRDLPPELLTWLYETMVVTRDLDGEWVNLQRQGELALYAACRGQEAAQVGATACLRKTDWLFPQYRELGAFLVRGITPTQMAAMWRGTWLSLAYVTGRVIEFDCDDRRGRMEWGPSHRAYIKGRELRIRIDAADALLLEQILRNLVGNAVQNTLNGGVLVGVRPHGRTQVRLVVIDTGPGLDPAWLDDDPPGGGLGLGIVRRCARLMQAPLSLRSTPGRGSSFSLVLPRLTPAALSRASSS